MHSAMIKQVLNFNKKAFDDSFNAVIAVQEHTEKMVRVFWEKSPYFPEEGKKLSRIGSQLIKRVWKNSGPMWTAVSSLLRIF